MKIRLGGETLEAQEGETLLSALAAAGIALNAPCGGRGICGKCKVRLLRGEVRGTAPDEKGLVSACRAMAASDLELEPAAGEEILENELGPGGSAGTKAPVRRAGIALDIGTTTLSAQLVDLDRAEAVDSLSLLNDQRLYGADVMSRIECARQGKTGDLHRLINRQTDKIIRGFIEKFNPDSLEALCVSGNTTMLHLFVKADPSPMGVVPFTPVFLEEKEFPGAELNLPVKTVRLLPSAASFFGADIVAGLAVLDILASRETALLIDIGTNGEIGLFHRGRLLCCSTAAGPAFEGAEISCGTGGIRGAVNRVSLAGGGVSFKTIGDAPALGLCGCGLIDAVAVMLKKEIIDETGAFNGEPKKFVITGDISVNDRDIRQYQLAKSAIQSGIRILCGHAGLALDEVQRVFIAGGFGFFIDIENAVSSGVLPEEFAGKISICGNSSLQGAVKALVDPGFTAKCRAVVEQGEMIELATDPAFMEVFTENMLFNP